jgi:hypothetical protein
MIEHIFLDMYPNFQFKFNMFSDILNLKWEYVHTCLEEFK